MRSWVKGLPVPVACAQALEAIGPDRPHRPALTASTRSRLRRDPVVMVCSMVLFLGCQSAQVNRRGVQQVELFGDELEFKKGVGNVLLLGQDGTVHRGGAVVGAA